MGFFRPVGRDVALRKGLANQVGNITECALLGFMLDLGMVYLLILWSVYGSVTSTVGISSVNFCLACQRLLLHCSKGALY